MLFYRSINLSFSPVFPAPFCSSCTISHSTTTYPPIFFYPPYHIVGWASPDLFLGVICTWSIAQIHPIILQFLYLEKLSYTYKSLRTLWCCANVKAYSTDYILYQFVYIFTKKAEYSEKGYSFLSISSCFKFTVSISPGSRPSLFLFLSFLL